MDDNLSELIKGFSWQTDAAQRRLWAARDRVVELDRTLALAQSELAAAEREHDQAQAILLDAWSLFRSERAVVA